MTNQLTTRPSQGLSITVTPSSQALVMAEMLELCAQIQGRDLLPGETRLWGQMFSQSSPTGLKWAFEEHLRTSKYFPKPAEIASLIERWAEANRNEYVGMTAEQEAELDRHQQSKGWEAARDELRAKLKQLAGKVTMEGPRPQPHIPTTVELAEELAKTAHIRGKR